MHWRLVDDWRAWHRWYSVRFLALGSAAQTAVVTAKMTGLADYVQPLVLTGLADFALFCMLAAGISRVFKQGKDDAADPDKPA